MNSSVSDVVFKYSPQDWGKVRLGELFESSNVKLRDYDADGKDIPVLSMTRTQGLILQSEKFDKRVASKDTSPYKVVKQGQLVIGFPIDEACIAILHRYPIGIVSPAYQVLSPIREIDLTFIDYYLRTPALIQIYRTFSSTVVERRRSISVRDFASIEVPIPTLAEQRRIARVLSTVQTAIEQQARLIALTRELKSALMHKLFTEGLRGEKQKQTEIGLVSESWEVKPLESMATAIDYGTSIKCDYLQKGFPVLRIPNVVGGKIDISDLKYGQPKKNEIPNLKLVKGDLLFVRTNGVQDNAGRCSIFSDELGDCYFASYLIRVRLDTTQLIPEFLNEYVRTETGRSFLSGRAIRTADGKFNINSGTIRHVLVPIPKTDEQEEIAIQLNTLEQKIYLHLQKQVLLQELFRTLLHQLMTAQIRVNELDLSNLL